MIKQTIARILSTELDRKDFLKAVGIGLVAATGITQAVNSAVKSTSSTAKQSTMLGYGASAYGGNPVNQ